MLVSASQPPTQTSLDQDKASDSCHLMDVVAETPLSGSPNEPLHISPSVPDGIEEIDIQEDGQTDSRAFGVTNRQVCN